MEFATVFILISTGFSYDLNGKGNIGTHVIDTFATYAECKSELMEQSIINRGSEIRWYEDNYSNLTFTYGREEPFMMFAQTCLKTRKR